MSRIGRILLFSGALLLLGACSKNPSKPATSSGSTPAAHAFVTKWGAAGSGNGQFDGPVGVAVDGSGNVYVADLGNARIQKFTNAGVFSQQIGTPGTGNGQFTEPLWVAVDVDGNLYASDAQRIQKFNSSGSYVAQWGGFGSGNGQFHSIGGIATRGGFVYVVDSDASSPRVQKFTTAGVYVSQWGSAGSGNSQFLEPAGIAVDGNGNVFVVDNGNHRVQRFTGDGVFVTKWGTFGTGDGQFRWPAGIAIDAANQVYVTDSDHAMAPDAPNHRVQVFSNGGPYLTRWGSQGSGNGQFDYPQGIAVDASGNVFVADWGNQRVQKFSN